MDLHAYNLGRGPAPQVAPKQRVIFYIDGFNLYYGLKAKKWGCYYWLNLWSMASNLVLGDRELVGLKYFTSRVSDPPDKVKRQTAFLDALASVPQIEIFYGQYCDKDFKCPACQTVSSTSAEKMTDVNIATHLMADAFQDRFDVAYIVSGDSDLVPPMAMIRKLFPDKWLVAAFPPARASNSIIKTVQAHFFISKTVLKASQFPDIVIGVSGFSIRRPATWA